MRRGGLPLLAGLLDGDYDSFLGAVGIDAIEGACCPAEGAGVTDDDLDSFGCEEAG